MTLHQKIFSVVTGMVIFLTILELVRRRKLKEEYSWIWLLVGSIIAAMVIKYELLETAATIIGSQAGTTTLFIFSILLLIIINLFFSVKISSLSTQIKNLAQKIAILESKPKRGKVHVRKKKRK